ncbi:MAG: hypothetical protein CFE29_18090 [Bradyrhizobiaceae bacterium PARB1]|nr:MAG: hypothetical protein CFE29_18090 [Bradyrhizobiaceae bacterium PARB1]
MENFEELLAVARRRFSASEMMLLASSAMGRTLDPDSLVEQVGHDMATMPVFQMMLERYNIRKDRLNSKLAGTPHELRVAILIQLNAFHRLGTDEAMGANALPSIATLRRMGLVLPEDGDPAWGFFCVRVGMRFTEFVLRHPERLASVSEGKVQTLAEELVDRFETASSAADKDEMVEIVYRIAKSTGWRHGLVVSDGDCVKATKIAISELLSDVYDSSLQGVVLAGVNAPDPF